MQAKRFRFFWESLAGKPQIPVVKLNVKSGQKEEFVKMESSGILILWPTLILLQVIISQ